MDSGVSSCRMFFFGIKFALICQDVEGDCLGDAGLCVFFGGLVGLVGRTLEPGLSSWLYFARIPGR